MKNLAKVMFGVAAFAAVTASAGQYPFPQNMKNPYGTTIEYADTKMIQEHYKLWKGAWYQASNGWVLAPEGTCSTVSEAIAYGMLITVYMDEEDTFNKLYGVWKENGGNGGGMNWRVGCQSGSGSATDADEDAALALVMASKQWNKESYLNDAKTIIKWIAENDVDGNNSLKPGNQWNPALNPSYVMPGHYRLFEAVTGDSKWSTIRTKAMKDLLACQDAATGLVGDWCDWSSHKTISSPGAAVSNDIGSYDDAARTPWRTAWGYYWYGDADAKKFNEVLSAWLIPSTRTASAVNSGFKWTGNGYVVDESAERNFASSTFSGGLGLATSSLDSKEAVTYFGTVYKALSSFKSCEKADGCGSTVPGEKYYPATLNMLYLLLMTGNMPNLYEADKFVKFNPDPSKAPSVSEVEGEHLAFGDTTVSVSGLWNWGAYHDKLGIGTKMVPDSGASPLYRKADGNIYAEASMEIGPEPEWTQEKADAGLLKYPSAGIAVSFKKDECKTTKTCGVDFSALGIKYVRVSAKATGPIRFAVLNDATVQAGAEPGIYVDPTNDYAEVTYDLTPEDYGFKGFVDGNNFGGLMDWVDLNTAPEGAEIVKVITGFKWEVKDAKGGIGEISIKSIEFLDASKQAIDPVLVTGMKIEEKPNALYNISLMPQFSVRANGMQVEINGAKAGSVFAVYNMQGKAIAGGMLMSDNMTVRVPTTGSYIVRVGSQTSRVNVK